MTFISISISLKTLYKQILLKINYRCLKEVIERVFERVHNLIAQLHNNLYYNELVIYI